MCDPDPDEILEKIGIKVGFSREFGYRFHKFTDPIIISFVQYPNGLTGSGHEESFQ